jgi:type IV pilus assembly protein PilN
MIRINLLPIRSVKKQELGRQQIFLFGLLVVGAVIGNFYWFGSTNSKAEHMAAQVSQARKELADLDKIIGEVKNYAQEKEALEEKLKVLETLKKGRSGPVKMLDAMATAIPKNVWLKQMDQKTGAMALEGSAISNDDLAEFMKALANVVWTPEGMGRLVERSAGTTSRVELMPSGQIKDLPVDKVGVFFKDIALKKSALRAATKSEQKVVDFSLTLTANYAI